MEKLISRDCRCVICGFKSQSNDVHHLDYKNLKDVELLDLVVLCRRHHDDIHRILDGIEIGIPTTEDPRFLLKRYSSFWGQIKGARPREINVAMEKMRKYLFSHPLCLIRRKNRIKKLLKAPEPQLIAIKIDKPIQAEPKPDISPKIEPKIQPEIIATIEEVKHPIKIEVVFEFADFAEFTEIARKGRMSLSNWVAMVVRGAVKYGKDKSFLAKGKRDERERRSRARLTIP